MPQNIVLCSDGTGNRGGVGRGTNVWRIFKSVDLTNERVKQLAFYDDGVGTSDFRILKILGGAFGWGLSQNILDLYTSLVRTYVTGDKIFLFGFSRGAFTVRSLAGFISQCGVVDRHKRKSPAELEERIEQAYTHYRNLRWKQPKISVLRSKQEKAGSDEAKQQIQNKIDALLARVTAFKAAHCVPAPIEFIGVWDTVDAVGLPVDELTDALDKRYPVRFHQHDLSPNVTAGYHALAIDDERHTFHPVLWDESRKAPGQVIEQVWFAGMHSNVGGGYPKDEVAHVSLNWMIEKAKVHGLVFDSAMLHEFEQQENVNSKLYDSRAGLAVYYRLKQRHINHLCEQAGISMPTIHDSVFDRLRIHTDGYAPSNIPNSFNLTPSMTPCDWLLNLIAPRNRHGWQTFMVRARNFMWLRRGLYFGLLFMTFLLIVAGLTMQEETAQRCVGDNWLCGATNILIDTAALLTPSILETWLNGFRANPGVIAFLLGGFLALGFLSHLTVKITEETAQNAWAIAFPLGPKSKHPGPSLFHDVVLWMRHSYLIETITPWFHQKILPWVVIGATAAVALQIAGKLLWENQLIEEKCTSELAESGKLEDLAVGKSASFDIKLDDACNVAPFRVQQGGRYAIDVETLGVWHDASIDAGPTGFRNGMNRVWNSSKLVPFLSMRRNISERWFYLMGSIGDGATNEFPIGEGVDLIRFQESGPVNIFVNDAVCTLCFWDPWRFYRNNRSDGEFGARITVKHLAHPAKQ